MLDYKPVFPISQSPEAEFLQQRFYLKVFHSILLRCQDLTQLIHPKPYPALDRSDRQTELFGNLRSRQTFLVCEPQYGSLFLGKFGERRGEKIFEMGKVGIVKGILCISIPGPTHGGVC
jgi:hypothetical protein